VVKNPPHVEGAIEERMDVVRSVFSRGEFGIEFSYRFKKGGLVESDFGGDAPPTWRA
jgi:hypothetical protein